MKPTFAKLNISTEADRCVNRMVEVVNKDTSRGKVTKIQLVSWALIEFEKKLFTHSISRIRAAHFNEISYLQGIITELRLSKQSGESNPALNEVLSKLKRTARKQRANPAS